MPGLALALGLCASLGAASIPVGGPAPAIATLEPRLSTEATSTDPLLVPAATGAHSHGSATPVCIGDVCQPVVAVPGYEARLAPPSRNELVAVLLDRARIEPLATVAWGLLATGVRFEWDPGAFDGHNGWGSLTLGIKLRLDAFNTPVLPHRPRGRRRHRPARRRRT